MASGIALGYRAGPGSWNVRAADDRGSNWIKSFAIADDLRSYVLRLPGRRHEPSPDAFDEFVETSLSSPDRTKLATWIAELRR